MRRYPSSGGTESDSKSPNAKNPDFAPPVDLPSVSPQDYAADIESGRGSAAPQRPSK